MPLARWYGATCALVQLTLGAPPAPSTGLTGTSVALADDSGTRRSLHDAGPAFPGRSPLTPTLSPTGESEPAPAPEAPTPDATDEPRPDAEHDPAEPPRYDVEGCFAELTRAGVAYERVPPEVAPRVLGPLRLRGPLGGVVVESTTSTRVHDIVACPLAIALLSVSDILRTEGVVRIETYSIYRPAAAPAAAPRRARRRRRYRGSSGRHPRALAIDIGAFVRENAPPLRVLEHWGPRARRRLRCTPATMTAPRRGRRRVRGVTAASAALHRIHCGVAARRVFTVMLSPHYNREHHNHFHWDVDPAVPWRSVY